MKLKYLFPLFIATLILAVSCVDEPVVTLLDEIQVSSSYVAISEDGGSTSITVTARDSWTAEKVTTDKDPVEWLTLSSTSGSAGESQVTFSAQKGNGRSAEGFDSQRRQDAENKRYTRRDRGGNSQGVSSECCS